MGARGMLGQGRGFSNPGNHLVDGGRPHGHNPWSTSPAPEPWAGGGGDAATRQGEGAGSRSDQEGQHKHA